MLYYVILFKPITAQIHLRFKFITTTKSGYILIVLSNIVYFPYFNHK